MPPRSSAKSKAAAARKPAARTVQTGSSVSPWWELFAALLAVPGPMWRLLLGGFSLGTVAALFSLAMSCSLMFGQGGCSNVLPVPGPATSIGRRAADLATQRGFTSGDRTLAAGVFKKVADEIRNGSHQSATTVDASTRSDLAINFGARWTTVGQPWLNELAQAWKGRFRGDSPPQPYEALWREIAAGLGG